MLNDELAKCKGALNLQDLKMADHEKTIARKCRTRKMRDQIAGWNLPDMENGGPEKLQTASLYGALFV